MIGRVTCRACATCLILWTGAAAAQDCTPIAFAPVDFCAAGTEWQGWPTEFEQDDNGDVNVVAVYRPDAVLIFSIIPEADRRTIPADPDAADMAATLDSFAALVTADGRYLDLGERSAPLGDDVAAASLGLHITASGWTGIYTFYGQHGAALSVQTAIRGSDRVTDRLRDLNSQALHALTADTARPAPAPTAPEVTK